MYTCECEGIGTEHWCPVKGDGCISCPLTVVSLSIHVCIMMENST